jgi:galactokinase
MYDSDHQLLAQHARDAFTAAFGVRPALLAQAPGRVNLIGEHTDYNDGFVLPMAIDRSIVVAVSPRTDGRVRAHAAQFGETREVAISRAEVRAGAWDTYVAGVVWALTRAGLSLVGADLAIVSDLPMGAGLSSSAALELATARALCAASGIEWDPRRMAELARTAENEFVGVPCGIMDQFASSVSAEGCALLLDCRSLEARLVAIPRSASVVVMDTGVRRSLAASAYSDRRAACARAIAAIQSLEPTVNALRDVSDALLARARTCMDEDAYRRATHVVSEIPRPVAMSDRLEAGDLDGAGRLMNDSHASLRDLYEVSSEELDAIVSAAQAHRACYGARLTGAGFGGCAIALVTSGSTADFARSVSASYVRRTGRNTTIFVSRPAPGARLIE